MLFTKIMTGCIPSFAPVLITVTPDLLTIGSKPPPRCRSHAALVPKKPPAAGQGPHFAVAGKEMVTHALRHHYASLLLAAGESVVAAADRLGDENATLVFTMYGHLMQDSEDRMRTLWGTREASATAPLKRSKSIAELVRHPWGEANPASTRCNRVPAAP